MLRFRSCSVLATKFYDYVKTNRVLQATYLLTKLAATICHGAIKTVAGVCV